MILICGMLSKTFSLGLSKGCKLGFPRFFAADEAVAGVFVEGLDDPPVPEGVGFRRFGRPVLGSMKGATHHGSPSRA